MLGAAIAAPMVSTVPAAAAAASRIDRIMVQGRPQDSASLYKVRNIMLALDRLGGVRKMRCREPYSGTPGWKTYVGLAQLGVRFCFTLSIRDVQKIVGDLKAFLAVAPNSVWAIEYPNEPDLNPVKYKAQADRRLGFRTGEAPALMAFIADAHAALRADPALKRIPIVASNDFMQPEQKPFADFANTHIYPKGASDIGRRIDGFERRGRAAGYASGVITEWGRTTGGGVKNATAPPVSLDEQGALLASDVAAALQRPFVRVINLYELFAWGGASEQNNFGLFSADLSPRPAVEAIRSVIR